MDLESGGTPAKVVLAFLTVYGVICALWNLRTVLWALRSSALRRLSQEAEPLTLIAEIDEELKHEATTSSGQFRVTRNWLVVFQMGAAVIPLKQIVGVELVRELYRGRELHRLWVFTEDGRRDVFPCKNGVLGNSLAFSLRAKAPWADSGEDLQRRWEADKRAVIETAVQKREALLP